MARCPKTAEEAWKRLDKRLSEEDKKAIIEAEGMWEFHFTLGMWIRNNWIYGGEEDNLKSLMKELGAPVFKINDFEEVLIPSADMASSDILEAYKKHLKKEK